MAAGDSSVSFIEVDCGNAIVPPSHFASNPGARLNSFSRADTTQAPWGARVSASTEVLFGNLHDDTVSEHLACFVPENGVRMEPTFILSWLLVQTEVRKRAAAGPCTSKIGDCPLNAIPVQAVELTTR